LLLCPCGTVGKGVYDSENLGLYSYGHQNPVRLVDPDGNAPDPFEIICGTVAGGVAGGVGEMFDHEKGEGINWKNVGAGVIAGGVGGAALGASWNPMLAGAAQGVILEGLKEKFNNKPLNPIEIGKNAGIGFILGGITSLIPFDSGDILSDIVSSGTKAGFVDIGIKGFTLAGSIGLDTVESSIIDVDKITESMKQDVNNLSWATSIILNQKGNNENEQTNNK
jgi:hypothetical protein